MDFTRKNINMFATNIKTLTKYLDDKLYELLLLQIIFLSVL